MNNLFLISLIAIILLTGCDTTATWATAAHQQPAASDQPPALNLYATAIKRRDTLRGLREIAHGRARSEYAQRLLSIVAARWQQIATNPACAA